MLTETRIEATPTILCGVVPRIFLTPRLSCGARTQPGLRHRPPPRRQLQPVVRPHVDCDLVHRDFTVPADRDDPVLKGKARHPATSFET